MQQGGGGSRRSIDADKAIGFGCCDVRFGSLADICSANRHVRFAPESGHVQCNSACPLSANSGHSVIHSITSSAEISMPGGMVMPSALAVLRLMTSSNLAAWMTGKSATLVPLMMRPT